MCKRMGSTARSAYKQRMYISFIVLFLLCSLEGTLAQTAGAASVSVIPNPLPLGSTSAIIRAQGVTIPGTLAPQDPVWSVVTHPRGPGEHVPTQTNVPMTLIVGNTYEGSYNGFTDFGAYPVMVYAKDTEGVIWEVAQTTAYQPGFMDKFEKFEGDDTYSQAHVIHWNVPYAQQHNFHDYGDEDWVKFYALDNETYRFRATNLSPSTDVVMELYDTDGSTLITQWNSAGPGDDEIHEHTFSQSGIYYMKSKHANPGVFGYGTGYDLYGDKQPVSSFSAGVYGQVTNASNGSIIEGAIAQLGSGVPTISDEDGTYVVSSSMCCASETLDLSVTMTNYNDFTDSDLYLSGFYVPIDVSLTPTCWDSDGDGYGNPGDTSCSSGSAEDDCDDSDASIYPGASETPDDGIDQDCNGTDTVTCYVDADQDGYGTYLGTTTLADDGTCDITQSESENADDCDDSDDSINPAATEVVADGIDQDCNGEDWCYLDSDGDTYGSTSEIDDVDGDLNCATGAGVSDNNTDCDDGDANLNPGGEPVRVTGSSTAYYSSLQTAYDSASDGDTIECKETTLSEDIEMDRGITVTVEGGFECSFSSVSGVTTISSSTSGITISDGTVTMEYIDLQ
jgi:hypothetical protein